MTCNEAIWSKIEGINYYDGYLSYPKICIGSNGPTALRGALDVGYCPDRFFPIRTVHCSLWEIHVHVLSNLNL